MESLLVKGLKWNLKHISKDSFFLRKARDGRGAAHARFVPRVFNPFDSVNTWKHHRHHNDYYTVSLEGITWRKYCFNTISSHTASVNSPNLQTLINALMETEGRPWSLPAYHSGFIHVYDTSLHQVNLITSRIVNFQKMIITIKNEYKETKAPTVP